MKPCGHSAHPTWGCSSQTPHSLLPPPVHAVSDAIRRGGLVKDKTLRLRVLRSRVSTCSHGWLKDLRGHTMSPLLPRLKSLEQFPSSRDGTQRLEQTAWHCVIRPHWPPRPLLPSSLPSPEGNLHQHPDWVRQGSASTVFYWPPPHPRPWPPTWEASSPQPSLCRLSPKPSLELPPHWGRSYKSTKQALFWFLYLPLSLQTVASPLKQDTGTTGTLWELVRHAESWAHSDLLPQGLRVINKAPGWFLHLWKFGSPAHRPWVPLELQLRFSLINITGTTNNRLLFSH